MLRISEKAIELLRLKLDLDYKEEQLIVNDFFENSSDKNDEIKKDIIKIKKDNDSEKTILKDILANFKSINASFDNIIKLIIGNSTLIPPKNQTDPEEIPNPNEMVNVDATKVGGKKSSGGFLKTLGFGLFAFAPAILKFIKDVDPEKIGETFTKAFTWLKEDLPNFFKNDLGPFIRNFLDKEIIGSLTGMDILKAAGIAAILKVGTGVVTKVLISGLLKTVGFFLTSLFGFLVSPAGLAILAAAGFVGALMYGIKKIGEYGDDKRAKEAQEKWDAERAAEAAPYVEANNITKEVMDAAPESVKQKGSSVRGLVAGKVEKILKSKDAEMFKKLPPKKKWEMIDKSLTVDEKRSLMGKEKTLRDQLDDPGYKSETPTLDAKVAQMFPDTTMVMQDDYKTQLLGTPEQRKAAREALAKENVKAEDDPVIKSAKDAELEAKPMPTRNPNAISVDTSKTVDASTGGGTPSYSGYSSSGSTASPAPASTAQSAPSAGSSDASPLSSIESSAASPVTSVSSTENITASPIPSAESSDASLVSSAPPVSATESGDAFPVKSSESVAASPVSSTETSMQNVVVPNADVIKTSLDKMNSQEKDLYGDTIRDLLKTGVSSKALKEAGGDPIQAKELEKLYPDTNWYENEKSTQAKPEQSSQNVSSFEPTQTTVGTNIERATIEATKVKKSSPVIRNQSTNLGSDRSMTIKPGQSWNINDVPDPTPLFGSLSSQLFVTDLGAIGI